MERESTSLLDLSCAQVKGDRAFDNDKMKAPG